MLMRLLAGIAGAGLATACGLIPTMDPCTLTLTQIHEQGSSQEREELAPPYRLAMTSMDQNEPDRRIARLEITGGAAWAAGDRINFTYTEAGAAPMSGHAGAEALDYDAGGGLSYVMAVPGPYELRLAGEQCEETVRWEVLRP